MKNSHTSMDKADFLSASSQISHLVANFHTTNEENQTVVKDSSPGFLKNKYNIPSEPPQDGEPWENVRKDVETVLLKNLPHYHHPFFNGFFPPTSSFESMLGDMLDAGMANPNFTWFLSSTGIELEMQMMDWFAKMMKLPHHFMHESNIGGGVIYASGSESTFMATLAARAKILKILQKKDGFSFDGTFSRLIGYTSEQCHESVERAFMLNMTRWRKLPVDEKDSLRGETVRKALEEDINNGFIPYMVVATLGTTNSTAVDNIKEIGLVCKSNNIWLHIDGAFGGCATICPAFQHHLKGIEYADSYFFNPFKLLPIQHEGSLMFYANKDDITSVFHQDLNALMAGENMKNCLERPAFWPKITGPDFKDWQIHLGTRNRSLKMWFVVRMLGVKGLQDRIMNKVKLAKNFETLIRSHELLEVVSPVSFTVVCYRMKVSSNETHNDEYTKKLKQYLQYQGKILTTSGESQHKFYLRMCVSDGMSKEHVMTLFTIISDAVQYVLEPLKHRNC